MSGNSSILFSREDEGLVVELITVEAVINWLAQWPSDTTVGVWIGDPDEGEMRSLRAFVNCDSTDLFAPYAGMIVGPRWEL